MMERLLWEKFQFNKANILVLKDEEATRENILRQFNDFLIARASPDAQAVFYYSGHGSQMTDLNADEMDDLDETIVPHDARGPANKIHDISDDELGALLAKLSEKSNNVTVERNRFAVVWHLFFDNNRW